MTDEGLEDWERQTVRLTPEPPARVASAGGCHAHPQTMATSKCAGCERLWCDECAPEKLLSGELVRFCTVCGGVCVEVTGEEASTAASPPSASAAPSTLPLRRPAPPPPPRPEPPPPDRQLPSILLHPFKGFGSVWVLTWCLVTFAAWPVGVMLLVAYSWSLYLSVERGASRIPGVWKMGTGMWDVIGRWLKSLISPGLPCLLCWALLTSRPLEGSPSSARLGTLGILGLVVSVVLLLLVPMMLTVLFRTGSPFKSLDPTVLAWVFRLSPPRYLACLRSLVAVGVLSMGIYFAVRALPLTEIERPFPFVVQPALPTVAAGVMGGIWGLVTIGRYGQWVSWVLEEE